MWWIFDCTNQRGVSPATEEVSYGGYVHTSPLSDAPTLDDGALSFLLAGAQVVEAAQPYAETYPGYWSAVFPASTDFQLKITGDALYPSIWAGCTPASDGAWFNGALFGGSREDVDGILASVGLGSWSEDGVTVWGEPLDPENWDCAAVRVQGQPVVCVTVEEDGSFTPVTEGTFDWFFAFHVAPGQVLVDSGRTGTHSYLAAPGDLVMAFWFVGGEP